MEKELFEKYADKLLSAMKREGLMNKEVAAIFDVPASYMSGMGRHPEKVSGLLMEKIRTWAISGKPLREYKLPEAPDVDAAAITQQKLDETEKKFRSKLAVKALAREHAAETAAAIAKGINTEEPTKEDVAVEIREQYERVQPKTEMKIVAHKDGKVDVSRIAERMPTVDDAENAQLTYEHKQTDCLDRFSYIHCYRDFMAGIEWLRSRLTNPGDSQKTEGGGE